MGQAVRFIGIGLLIVFADLKINGFDLLPDLLGYALVGWGVYRLSHRRPQFKPALVYTAALALTHLMRLVADQDLSTWMGGGAVIIHCFWIWTLLNSIAGLLEQAGEFTDSERLKTLAIVDVSLTGVVGFLPFSFLTDISPLDTLAGIALLVVRILDIVAVFKSVGPVKQLDIELTRPADPFAETVTSDG